MPCFTPSASFVRVAESSEEEEEGGGVGEEEQEDVLVVVVVVARAGRGLLTPKNV
jgi:hypothetical protein